jgi:enamine deaminase RidA (YjgF/YER057c/UK114 family)
MADIVAMTVFITDWRYGSILERVRIEALGDHLATSATIGVVQLATPELLIEIQCTAVRPPPA